MVSDSSDYGANVIQCQIQRAPKATDFIVWPNVIDSAIKIALSPNGLGRNRNAVDRP